MSPKRKKKKDNVLEPQLTFTQTKANSFFFFGQNDTSLKDPKHRSSRKYRSNNKQEDYKKPKQSSA